MHAHIRNHLAVLGLVALAVLLALPGGALAAKPTFHDHFTDTVPDSGCGVFGTSVVTFDQIGRLSFDANGNLVALKITGEVTIVFTADDGRSATLHVAGQSTGSFVDHGDGTATVVNTYKGLPEQIRGGGGSVATRDAGLLSFVTTFDIATGEVISADVVEHGPHPEADSDFALFCDAFLAALG
jgi:hypothetical protein